MIKIGIRGYLFAAIVIASSSIAVAHEKDEVGASQVHFPVSCNAEAAAIFRKAVAQLHHMMYLNARGLFRDASEADRKCAIALWGVSMTYIHPLWPDRPSDEILAIGESLMKRAMSIGGSDAREDAYIATTYAYFVGGEDRTEAQRLLRFEAAWKALFALDPDDQEAKVFYALSQLATAPPNDKTYAKQLAAGAMAEEVLDDFPDHPGAHHYIIHAYDFPGLASRALGVAQNYGDVGPDVPHALHMMSHIFTRLGHWAESAKWNRRSARAALVLSEEIGAISVHYQHALDYLAYAYLQMGADPAALNVVQTLAALESPFDLVNRDAQAYAFAATPARYVLERKDWAGAAKLEAHVPAAFPWEPKHEAYVAQTHFAKGLGLAHEGRFKAAAAEAAMLDRIRDNTRSTSVYWSTQVEIQALGVKAWIHYLAGDPERGIRVMREAEALESGTSKSPVTPGAVIPAAELLGEMLVLSERFKEAVAAFEMALKRSPRRLNSMYGAALALEQLGDSEAANIYFTEIVVMANKASTRSAIMRASRLSSSD
jgi:tetratricopeptide (TPR) repeat protein